MLSKKITDVFCDIPENILIRILFEMNRFYDKDLKGIFKDYKNKTGITLDSFQRKLLRLYYYYGNNEYLIQLNIEKFYKLRMNKKDVKIINDLTIEKLSLPNKNKIIKSIYSKFNELSNINNNFLRSEKWLSFYKEKYKNNYDLIIYKITKDMIKEKDYFNIILQNINYIYDRLNNYRYVAIVLDEQLYVNEIEISWSILFKLAVYMENFKCNKEKFSAFKKEQRINEMCEFLNNNKNLNKKDFKDIVTDFYSGISTGFIFNDLLISNNQSKKILIMKKITLDNSPIMCPSCLGTLNRGNSFPLMFLRSWECQNPSCPERSKSGRGKRFDEYGVYRYFKLVEKNQNNNISKELYNNWRRDLFSDDLDPYEMLIMYYSWNDEKVLFINEDKTIKSFDRKLIYTKYNLLDKYEFLKYNELPIYKLLVEVYKNYKKEKNINKKLNGDINIFNMDSTKGLKEYDDKFICAAITSPPYYNAREYSQWPNLITYLIDMMLNAKSVYDVLTEDGTYLYNVGDIVDTDNVYVVSNMSNRRIMLGFYSSLIFDIVGFNLVGNKIWDKGEVESKRNSTVNLVSGYVKYVNCYEHVLVFKKNNKQLTIDNKVYKIKPVYKINSKGQNILGHTAPFPEELVNLIKDYLAIDKYVLDPYLGSGTTGIWAKRNNCKFIGFELNKQYYELCKNRINNDS